MKIIRLNNGDITIVSNKDYKELSKYKWGIRKHKNGKYTYAVRYEGTGHNEKTILMHRQILKAPKGVPVDHKNHDCLDNRRCNIRLCKGNGNKHNRLPQGGTSKYKGVRKHSGGKWEARIMINGKHLYLGHFANEKDAAKTYQKAAIKYHGKFAYLG